MTNEKWKMTNGKAFRPEAWVAFNIPQTDEVCATLAILEWIRLILGKRQGAQLPKSSLPAAGLRYGARRLSDSHFRCTVATQPNQDLRSVRPEKWCHFAGNLDCLVNGQAL